MMHKNSLSPRILEIVAAHPDGVPTSVIAAELGIETSQMSSRLAKLAAAGRLVSHRTGIGNLRRNFWRICGEPEEPTPDVIQITDTGRIFRLTDARHVATDCIGSSFRYGLGRSALAGEFHLGALGA